MVVDVEGQRVLVTGAARNIGLAIARAFLERGARVLLFSLTESKLRAAVASLGPELRSRALAQVGDVRDRRAVDAALAKMVDAWGGVDVAVNNAGVYPTHSVLDMTEDDWDWVMDVNAKGTFLVSQACARRMIEQGTGGHIINISSGSYRFGRIGCAHYCASKAAQVMLTQVLAMELAAHGILVNAIAPGLIENEHVTPEYREAFSRIVPLGRIGRPEEIAAAVLMLVSSGCGYLTGQTISVDGGVSAGRFGLPLSGGDKRDRRA